MNDEGPQLKKFHDIFSAVLFVLSHAACSRQQHPTTFGTSDSGAAISQPDIALSGILAESRVVAGAAHSCVLRDRTLFCWGMSVDGPGQRFADWLPERASTDDERRVELLRRYPNSAQIEADSVAKLSHFPFGYCLKLTTGAEDCRTSYWLPRGRPRLPNYSYVAVSGWDVCLNSDNGLQCRGPRESLDGRSILWHPRSMLRSTTEYCALDELGQLFCREGAQQQYNRSTCMETLGPRLFGNEVMSSIRQSPVATGVAEAVAGDSFVYYRTDSGSIFRRIDRRSERITLPGPSVALTAGLRHVCSLQQSGSVYCWGDNSVGQLGDGTFVSADSPTLVRGLSGVKSLASGLSHNCVISDGRRVSCWGNPTLGRLGTDPTLFSMTPRHVLLPAPVRSAGAGWAHSCALLTNDEVYCWGRGTDGELALAELALPRGCEEIEMSVGRGVPQRVGVFAGATSIVVGGRMSCVRSPTQIDCWGFALGTALMDSSSSDFEGTFSIETQFFLRPRTVSNESFTVWERARNTAFATQGRRWTFTATEPSLTCRLNNGVVECLCKLHPLRVSAESAMECTGDGYHTVPLPADAVGLTVGSAHACAWLSNGELYCWGANEFSQLSTGSDLDSRVPREVRLPR